LPIFLVKLTHIFHSSDLRWRRFYIVFTASITPKNNNGYWK
jgi:hypothetical protein